MQSFRGYKNIKILGSGLTAHVVMAEIIENDLGYKSNIIVDSRSPCLDERIVALKIFHPTLWQNEMVRRRALKELDAYQKINHPNCVKSFGYIENSDTGAIILEYVDGESLEKFQTRLPYVYPELSVALVVKILEGLIYAHGQGITHRDLKPANIIVSTGNRNGTNSIVPKIADFGLSKIKDTTLLSEHGTLLGSPDFMAPETIEGKNPNGQSDLYSVGAILYFLTTGTRPFSRSNLVATLVAVRDGSFDPPMKRNPKVSIKLNSIIAKSLSRNPSNRFLSAAEMHSVLTQYLDGVGLGSIECIDIGQMNTPDKMLVDFSKDPTDAIMRALEVMATVLTEKAKRLALDPNANEIEYAQTLNHLAIVAPNGTDFSEIARMSTDKNKKSKRRRTFIVSAVTMPIIFIGLIALWGFRSKLEVKPIVAKIAQEKTTDEKTEPKLDLSETLNEKEPEVKAQANHFETDRKLKPVKALKAISNKGQHLERPKNPDRLLQTVSFDLPQGTRVFLEDKEVTGQSEVKGVSLGQHKIRLQPVGSDHPIEAVIEVTANEPTVIRAR